MARRLLPKLMVSSSVPMKTRLPPFWTASLHPLPFVILSPRLALAHDFYLACHWRFLREKYFVWVARQSMARQSRRGSGRNYLTASRIMGGKTFRSSERIAFALSGVEVSAQDTQLRDTLPPHMARASTNQNQLT